MKDLASIPHNIAIEGKEAGLDDRRPGVMLQFSREAVARLLAGLRAWVASQAGVRTATSSTTTRSGAASADRAAA